MNTRLAPIFTLADIYGPGLIYAPRAHPHTSRWISQDASLLDYLTGNQQTVLGNMPSIAGKGTASPAARELIEDAGLNPAPPTRSFQGERQALKATRDEIGRGRRIVIQHVYPTGFLSDDAFWIHPNLISYLNNKAYLPDFVAPQHVPARWACASAAIFRQFPERPLPFVLKVATDLSTGAGGAVAVCFTKQDVAAAAERFSQCESLIVESYLSIKQNLCLHFAVMSDGTTRYLGHAVQDVTQGGTYLGNWIELGSKLSPTLVEIACQIVQRAAARGYRGIAGIDIAVLDDERAIVLDLNFRVNGSTAAVLLSTALLENYGPAVLHLRTFTAPDGFEKMIAVARTAVRRGRIIPLNLCDPIAAGYDQGPARLHGLVVGTSRADALAIEIELASQGLN